MFCVCMCCVYMWVKCAPACVYVVCVFVYVYIICHCFLFPSLNPFFQTCSIAIIVLWNRMCKSLLLFYYHKDLEMLIFSTKCTLREENKILYARSHYSLFKRKKEKNVIFEYFYMLGTMSGALQAFSHLITRTVMEDRYYHCHSHFTDKETESIHKY